MATRSSPRPLSAYSSACVKAGGCGLASQTRISTCVLSVRSHSRTGGICGVALAAATALVVSSETTCSAWLLSGVSAHSQRICRVCRRAEGTAPGSAPSSRKSCTGHPAARFVPRSWPGGTGTGAPLRRGLRTGAAVPATVPVPPWAGRAQPSCDGVLVLALPVMKASFRYRSVLAWRCRMILVLRPGTRPRARLVDVFGAQHAQDQRGHLCRPGAAAAAGPVIPSRGPAVLDGQLTTRTFCAGDRQAGALLPLRAEDAESAGDQLLRDGAHGPSRVVADGETPVVVERLGHRASPYCVLVFPCGWSRRDRVTTLRYANSKIYGWTTYEAGRDVTPGNFGIALLSRP